MLARYTYWLYSLYGYTDVLSVYSMAYYYINITESDTTAILSVLSVYRKYTNCHTESIQIYIAEATHEVMSV